jgi:transposase InsO family protein
VWATREQARRVLAYINYYNHHRLHSTLKRFVPHVRPASATVHPSPSRHEPPVSDPGVEPQ